MVGCIYCLEGGKGWGLMVLLHALGKGVDDVKDVLFHKLVHAAVPNASSALGRHVA